MRGIDWQRVVDVLADGLERASAELELERAIVGLDGHRELVLHERLAAYLQEAGFGVERERRFPSERSRKRNASRRCDLVLTRDGRPLASDGPPGLFDPVDAATDSDAGWLEVKVVAQHRPDVASAGYSQRLQRPVWNDVFKLAREPDIHDAAILILLFTADDVVADHDLDVWARRARDRGLALWPRRERSIGIGDRLGNRRARVAIFELERPPR